MPPRGLERYPIFNWRMWRVSRFGASMHDVTAGVHGLVQQNGSNQYKEPEGATCPTTSPKHA